MLSKTKITEILKYAVDNAHENKKWGEVNLTLVEEDVIEKFDLTDRQMMENDLSFKIFEALEKKRILSELP